MGQTIALDSLDRNLVREDEEIARDGRVYGGDGVGGGTQSEGGDPMRIVSAGPVTVNQIPPEPSKPGGNLNKLVMAAALAAGPVGVGIGGLGMLAWDALKSPPPAEAPVGTDTRNTFTLS